MQAARKHKAVVIPPHLLPYWNSYSGLSNQRQYYSNGYQPLDLSTIRLHFLSDELLRDTSYKKYLKIITVMDMFERTHLASGKK